MGRRQRLVSTVANAEGFVADGLHLISFQTRAAIKEGLRFLDNACGIRSTSRRLVGATLSAELGLRSLPDYLVRRVEYESVMRRFNYSEMEIACVHGLFSNSWYYGDVIDVDLGIEYVMRATCAGNVFAGKVLEWLSPEDGKGVLNGGGKSEWIRCIENGERERAVELGRIVGGGVRPDATVLVRLGNKEQKGLSANNIGYLLVNGHGGVRRNVVEGIKYYDMSIQHGSAAACNNKGFLLQYGMDAIEKDLEGAQQLYELAIERGERNHAPRNLAILYIRKREFGKAARWLLVGIREGDAQGKKKSETTLKRLVKSWTFRIWEPSLRNECLLELSKLDDIVV